MTENRQKVDIRPNETEEEKKNNLRPKRISGFIGQDNLKFNTF